jgi:tetratricopeptide (TPR) repeat protein
MKRASFFLSLFLLCTTFLPLFGFNLSEAGWTDDDPPAENLVIKGLSASNLLDNPQADVDSLFSIANSLYEKGSFEPALETYQSVILNGFESAELYYNMGNAAYRSNSIGHAILYYEKALKLEPKHEDARHNLDYVSRYRLDTFEEVPRLFLGVWVKAFVSMFPERTWSILSLIFFMFILSGLLVFLFSRRVNLRKTGFISGLIALFLFLISLSSALSRYRDIVSPDAGIILTPSVLVRSSPSESGTELFILHEGTKIEVNEEVSGWQNIKVIDGREGWIEADDFESI